VTASKRAAGRAPSAGKFPEDDDPARDACRDVLTRDDVPAETGGGGDAQLAVFAATCGVRFRDLELLRLALTHRSVLHDVIAAREDVTPASMSNERLEFLGDAVLGMVAAGYLYAQDPEADEGVLTARRVALVRAETLVRWAREIGLGDQLHLGAGERIGAGARDRMLAGAFEALVGAIWLDRGHAAATRFLRRFVVRDAASVIADQAVANAKGRLQELLQERYRRSPAYHTIATEGPPHARTFTVEVLLDGRGLGVGVGESKREAQQAAAAAALALIEAGHDPLDPAGTPALAHADRPGETIVPDPDEAPAAPTNPASEWSMLDDESGD
jgi:ribonuclease-3